MRSNIKVNVFVRTKWGDDLYALYSESSGDMFKVKRRLVVNEPKGFKFKNAHVVLRQHLLEVVVARSVGT